MFKRFTYLIAIARNKDELNEIFYGMDGINMEYQKGKLSWDDHQTLLKLIDKITGLMED